MIPNPQISYARQDSGCQLLKWAVILLACLLFPAAGSKAYAQENLLKNPGFEESTPKEDRPPNWTSLAEGAVIAHLSDTQAKSGRQCLALPAHSSVEQKVEKAEPGAYVARCWINSQSEQSVTLILRDADRPWAAYTCSEIRVPSNRWVQVEVFCTMDRSGTLAIEVGGMSKEFHFYHGTAGEMGAPILVDDCELIRYKPKTPSRLAVWDAKEELSPTLDWTAKDRWSSVESQSHVFAGTPVFLGRHVAGAVRKEDGGLAIYSVQNQTLSPRGVIVPSPGFKVSKCALIQANGRTGLQITSETADRSYTAWLTPKGVISIEPVHVPQFLVRDIRLRYGLLPSFVGADICYAPQKLPGLKQVSIPSTQWFVGLRDGNDSMLVAVWDTDTQAASLGLSGEGENRMIDSLSIATDKGGVSISFVEHDSLWREEPLKEDWLGEYVPIGWERPFPARWMGHFFVTTGGSPSFREPRMNYAFPIANAKTRMWGVWFEDWNHYPFYFDGERTMLHFEKSFIPNGEAIIYFLEPAAADLYSPCEIVEQVLGREKASTLFDFDGNAIRKLKYSTPNEFIYDRPVCATTTRLSKIKQEDKGTVGINLATHLYEFIREIRGRIVQYADFFKEESAYLDTEEKAHPEMHQYIAELKAMVAEAQSRTQEIYNTPLTTVQKQIDSMKKLLMEGKADGFDCGNLDVRGTAGAQDDLCRRYSRMVMRLTQTAALKCGDSPGRAVVAKHIWDQSRKVLREPTRWESRRTLYFFEP